LESIVILATITLSLDVATIDVRIDVRVEETKAKMMEK
jgi:hypothetical protein